MNCPTHSSDALLAGADEAVARGDLARLSELSEWLAARVSDSLRVGLLELAQLCRVDADLAVRRWLRLRHQVWLEVHLAPQERCTP